MPLKSTFTSLALAALLSSGAFSANNAHAIQEFKSDAASKQVGGLATGVTLASLSPKHRTSSNLPAFSSKQDVEAYFLDPEKGNNLFAALATRMEGLETAVYPDPARGRNIGIGYNMDEIGLGQARQDFASIGMSKAHIQILMQKDVARYREVTITPTQSVKLLLLAQPRFETIAKDWLGDGAWDQLSVHQKASVSYLAYQTGGNIEQFKKAKLNILSGNHAAAQKHLVTYYQDRLGATQKNTRFETHVGNMWKGPEVYATHVGVSGDCSKMEYSRCARPDQKRGPPGRAHSTA